MNEDRWKGRWSEIRGALKTQWAKLTDDDLKEIEGRAEKLAGKLQERHGVAREEAERLAKEFAEQFTTTH